MRTFLILAALGWIVSLPWATLFAYFLLIVIVLAVLWFLSFSIKRRAIPRCTGRNIIDTNYVAALETMVAEAEATIEALKAEVERLHLSRPVSEVDPKATLYRRVGLSPNAPEWLIQAARRAYRTQLHPDVHPAYRKQEAERRFKLSEATFEAIKAIRS